MNFIFLEITESIIWYEFKGIADFKRIKQRKTLANEWATREWVKYNSWASLISDTSQASN